LNLLPQGCGLTVFVSQEKIRAFQGKLKLWTRNVEAGIFSNFVNLESFLEELQEEKESLQQVLQSVVTAHMTELGKGFESYFENSASDDQWIRDPFCEPFRAEVNLTNQLANLLEELACDGLLRAAFSTNTDLVQFWSKVAAEYPDLSNAALFKLVQSPSSYACEAGFACLLDLKTKKRNRLQNVESHLRIKRTKFEPRWERLCKKIQEQGSH
jgi:hypothetical protein